MNQIKSLKLKIKRSSVVLDEKYILYCQRKKALHQGHNQFILPLFLLGALGFTFTLAFWGKLRNPVFKIGKKIAKIGLKMFWL